jgi:hypothetical protein
MGAPSAPAPGAAAPDAGLSSSGRTADSEASKMGRSPGPFTKLGVDFVAGVCGGIALTLVSAVVRGEHVVGWRPWLS